MQDSPLLFLAFRGRGADDLPIDGGEGAWPSIAPPIAITHRCIGAYTRSEGPFAGGAVRAKHEGEGPRRRGDVSSREVTAFASAIPDRVNRRTRGDGAGRADTSAT